MILQTNFQRGKKRGKEKFQAKKRASKQSSLPTKRVDFSWDYVSSKQEAKYRN